MTALMSTTVIISAVRLLPNRKGEEMKYEREVSSAAAALGRLGGMKGGKSRSAAKVAAVRESGGRVDFCEQKVSFKLEV